MTFRSIGDKVAQSVGVIPDPEILEYTLSPNDQFILLASDGVWENELTLMWRDSFTLMSRRMLLKQQPMLW